jgi:hypothetical protein
MGKKHIHNTDRKDKKNKEKQRHRDTETQRQRHIHGKIDDDQIKTLTYLNCSTMKHLWIRHTQHRDRKKTDTNRKRETKKKRLATF